MTRKSQLLLGLLILIGASLGTLVTKEIFFSSRLSEDNWVMLDSAVETFVKGQGGNIVSGGSSIQGKPINSIYKSWTIAIPEMNLDSNLLQKKVRALENLLTDLDPGFRGGSSSQWDRTIIEDSSHLEDVQFIGASGPGLRYDMESIGRTGAVFIEARGLTKNAGGLGGFTFVVNDAEIKEGQKAIVLELKVVKWK